MHACALDSLAFDQDKDFLLLVSQWGGFPTLQQQGDSDTQ